MNRPLSPVYSWELPWSSVVGSSEGITVNCWDWIVQIFLFDVDIGQTHMHM